MGEPPLVMFVAEKEEESKLTLAEHCRTHDLTIIKTDGLYKAHEKVRFSETIRSSETHTAAKTDYRKYRNGVRATDVSESV